MRSSLPNSALLVADDPGQLRAMATRLRQRGYLVHCVCGLDEAAALLRGGLVADAVFVRLTRAQLSPEAVREALATRLPGWSVNIHDAPATHGRWGRCQVEDERLN